MAATNNKTTLNKGDREKPLPSGVGVYELQPKENHKEGLQARKGSAYDTPRAKEDEVEMGKKKKGGFRKAEKKRRGKIKGSTSLETEEGKRDRCGKTEKVGGANFAYHQKFCIFTTAAPPECSQRGHIAPREEKKR